MALSDQFSDEKLGLRPGGPGKPLPAAPAAGATPATTAPADTTSNVPPLLSNIGSSAVQGLRDIGLTVGQGATAAGRALENAPVIGPAVRALDVRTGITPEAVQSTLLDPMTAQTQAYEAGPYAGTLPGMVARYGTQMAATAPFLGPLAGMVPEAGAGASMAARALSLAGKGAVMGGGTNLLASGGMGENPLTAAATGAAGGAVLGPLTGAVGGALGTAGGALSDAANRIGIDLTAGQKLGGLWRWVEDATKMNPLSGATSADARLQNQIGDVIRREAGIGGSGGIDTQALLQAKRDVGQRIGNAVQGTSLPGTDPALWNDLANVQTSAMAGTGPSGSAQASYFNNLMSELRARMAGGNLSGNDLQTMIQYGRPLQNAMSSPDPEIARVGQGFYDALMNGIERNNPGTADVLRGARYQYKVLATAEPQILKTAGGTDTMSNPGFARNIDMAFNQPRLNPTDTSGPNSNAMNDLAHVIRGAAPVRSSGTTERAIATAAIPGAIYAMQNPQDAERWLSGPGASILAMGLLGRGMRFTPGMITGPAALGGRLSQWAPSAFGPWIGRSMGNMLLGGNYQPAPGAPQ